MTQRYRFTRDGQPVTGSVPVQVRVRGGELGRTQAAEARALIDVFLTHVRSGDLRQLRRSYRMSDGSRVDLTHMFGVTTADVYPVTARSKRPEEALEFVGGIVLELRTPTGEVLPEAAASGVGPGKPGRPAVPGTLDTDTTTHVVVQIRRGANLADSPVAKGNVVIWRIKDPAAGPHAEVRADPERYLVSANSAFTEFYVQGKQLTSIPPKPSVVPLGVQASSRLATFGFATSDFEKQATAGVLVVAHGKWLHAYDTANPNSGWQLLATSDTTLPLKYINDFGDRVTYTANAGTQTLVCDGTNGAGARSSFTVVRQLLPDGSSTLSGSIEPRSDGSTPLVFGEATYTVQGTLGGSATRQYALDQLRVHVVNTIDLTRTYSVSGGMPERRGDRVFGGYLFHYSPVAYEENLVLHGTPSWLGWVETESDPVATYSLNEQYELSVTRAGATELALTFEWTSVAGLTPTPPSYTYSTPNISQVRAPLPITRAVDTLTGKLVVEYGVSGSETTASDFSDSAFDLPNLKVTGGVVTTTRTGLSISRTLKRANGAVLAHTPALEALYASPPTWTEPEEVEGLGDFEVERNLPHELAFMDVTPTPGHIYSAPILSMWSWGVLSGIDFVGLDAYLELMPGEVISNDGTTVITQYELYYGPGSAAVMDIADYLDLYLPSYYNRYTPPPPGTLVHSIEGQFPALETNTSSYYDASYDIGAHNPRFLVSANIYYDLRQDGFVVECASSDGLNPNNRESEMWLGNDVSIVPLSSVLDEWRALGTTSATPSAQLRISTTSQSGWLM